MCTSDVVFLVPAANSQKEATISVCSLFSAARQYGFQVRWIICLLRTSMLTWPLRNPYSSIHPRSSSLFDNYPGAADARSRPKSSQPPVESGYSYRASGAGSPYMNGGAQTGVGGFRPATPNSKYVLSGILGAKPKQTDTTLQ